MGFDDEDGSSKKKKKEHTMMEILRGMQQVWQMFETFLIFPAAVYIIIMLQILNTNTRKRDDYTIFLECHPQHLKSEWKQNGLQG